MSDRPMEDYTAPPHVIPGHPLSWNVVGATPGPGQVSIGATLEVAKLDDAGMDRALDLATLISGDVVHLFHGPGDTARWDVSGPPTDEGDYYAIPGAGSGQSFQAGDRVTIQITRAPIPVNAEPEPPPEPVDLTPSESWTKANIVQWLMDNGVDIGPEAVPRFTKAELLAIVEAYLNDDQAALEALVHAHD